MTSLRTRLVALFVLLALVVAGAIVFAVMRFSADQVMHLLMKGVDTQAQAQAMFDQYVARVLLIGAGVGVLLGGIAAWWLVRRVLRPLERLTAATHSLAAGDLAARVPEPPDRELRRLAQGFNPMAATLERVEQLRRSLVEDVAHELRTPLTSLRGYTEALADGVAEPTPEMLRNVHEEIERLTRLVEGLDQLARGEREVRQRARIEVDLSAVVHRALELASPELASRGITVRLEHDGDLPRPLAEPDATGQVMSNLVQNAARYTDEGGAITVACARRANGCAAPSRTTGRRSRPTTCRSSGSASIESTGRAREPRAERGSAWPSCARSLRPTAAPWARPPGRDGPRSGSGCQRDQPLRRVLMARPIPPWQRPGPWRGTRSALCCGAAPQRPSTRGPDRPASHFDVTFVVSAEVPFGPDLGRLRAPMS